LNLFAGKEKHMPRLKESTRIDHESGSMKPTAITLSNAPDILTRRQVAQVLQIGLSTLDTCIPPAKLPRIKLGKTVRFFRSDAEDYLLRSRTNGGSNE
jgi:predicted DNA-binding transcriptional regulator AlpA